MRSLVIYGPPGCGKTTDLLKRVDNLKNNGVDPKSISFMSFTKAAATEALKRTGLTRSNNICTIHAMCYRLLGMSSNFVVDIPKLRIFCDATGYDMGFVAGDQTEYDSYLAVSQFHINTGLSLEESFAARGGVGVISELYTFHKAYTDWKDTYSLMDFDDMLIATLAGKLKPEARHMIIDEAQDLTPLQWKVIYNFMDMPDLKSMIIAGDDDQALYAFSGANSAGMSEFEGKMGAERRILSQSYRVPRAVHKVATGIISKVTERVQKEYKPRPDDGKVSVVGDIDVSWLRQVQGPTMVLARTNYVVKKLCQDLRAMGIRHTTSFASDRSNREAAMAINVWRKLQAGNDITERDRLILTKMLDRRAKEAFNERDVSVLKKDWRTVMKIPQDVLNDIADFGEDFVLSQPVIEVSTIHSAKGKECENVVVMTELTDQVMSTMETDPDSEARVWYVAVTRAINNLVISGGYDGYPIESFI